MGLRELRVVSDDGSPFMAMEYIIMLFYMGLAGYGGQCFAKNLDYRVEQQLPPLSEILVLHEGINVEHCWDVSHFWIQWSFQNVGNTSTNGPVYSNKQRMPRRGYGSIAGVAEFSGAVGVRDCMLNYCTTIMDTSN